MNRVILEGRIATDLKPEQVGKHTKLTVLMACDRPRGKDNSGKFVDRGADFIRVVMWGSTAVNVAKYLAKGSRIALEGRVRGEFYEGKDGRKNLSIEVVADRVTFLESRSRAGKAA
jgi:single-strand DNA-binding protein